MAAAKQVQPAGQNDKDGPGAQRARHIARDKVDGGIGRQAAAGKRGVQAGAGPAFHPAPQRQDRAGCRVGKDLARPGQCGHRHPDSRGVERVVAFAAERLLGQHGNDDRRHHHRVGNAGRHHQHNEGCKTFA